MLAIVVPILVIGGIPYSLCIGLLGCIAFKELCDLKKEGAKDLPTIVKIFGLISMLFLIYSNFEQYGLLFGISYKVVCACSRVTLICALLSIPHPLL